MGIKSNMKEALLFVLIISLFLGCTPEPKQVIKGHAHNDYEHERPLFEALENGFISIEADVHVIDGKLYVSHDPPADLTTTKTLKELYLEPLRIHIKKNNGQVYKGYDEYVYLMIDIKTSAEYSYPYLREALAEYKDIISVITNAADQKTKPLKVLFSGNRPINALMNDSIKYAGIDGRPDELEDKISKPMMPVISQNYNRYLSWDGRGTADPKEVVLLKQMIEKAHTQGRKVRLWASSDIPEVWEFLLECGVDLINTDDLKGYREFALDGK
ncbi:MAG: phosphatidylinositol-specific phospholipase C/glycerophosphodiester phosphodiesterase family protein [Cyclobacteriaceae bacterium]